MTMERVQKILAQFGIASRRKAEALISQGLVTINGKPAKLGDKAVAGKDAIKVSGKLLHRQAGPATYLAFYKPMGVLSTLSDPSGRPTLANYLAKIHFRVFPIGRLDFNSEGLLLLTNDGTFANEFLSGVSDFPRIYVVKVKGQGRDPLFQKKLASLSRVSGLSSTRVLEQLTSKIKLEITLAGSKNTDIKLLLERKGFWVERIVRTAIGHVSLGKMRPGEYRILRKSQLTYRQAK